MPRLRLLLVAVLLAGCSTPTEPPPTSDITVSLNEIGSVERPTTIAFRPDDDTVYVTEQVGRVQGIRDGRTTQVLDITDQVGSDGNEQGLLGLAFSPNGDFAYLDYTDTEGDTRIVEWAVSDSGEFSARRDVLRQDQPNSNHNGGQLAFGPDGFLYIALGDGGGAGDPDGNGQSLDTLLGKILRINPRPTGDQPYGIPSDNPFVDRAGAKPEIWAYGLRNPWRFSFDSETGDLWIGDVGQGAWEEVNRQPADSDGGENYGWDLREGRHDYDGGDRPDGAVDPVIEYALNDGGTCSVIAGPVYRGNAIAGLSGHFVYGDFCAGWVRAAQISGDSVSDSFTVNVEIPQLSTFGADADGEMYAASLEGPVYQLTAG